MNRESYMHYESDNIKKPNQVDPSSTNYVTYTSLGGPVTQVEYPGRLPRYPDRYRAHGTLTPAYGRWLWHSALIHTESKCQ
jgi:hypothetical protein